MQDVKELRKENQGIKKEVQGLKLRQDEIYQMPRGWEEEKTFIRTNLDRLNLEMAKWRQHKHKIVLNTDEAEAAS